MKKIALITLSLSAFAFTSCTNFDTRRQNNAATGALIGAGVGAATGDNGQEARRNAAIGAGIGGAAGYLGTR